MIEIASESSEGAEKGMDMQVEMRELYVKRMTKAMPIPKFEMVRCSQCGKGFGPGNEGFSHCKHHEHLAVVED